MLTEWTLGNFKSVAEKTKLSLAPITVLVGENSSGKSTILQSVLLLAQTLRATASQQPLVLNGEYIRLGYLKDIVHDEHEYLPVQIGFVLHLAQSSSDNINDDRTVSSPIEFNFSVQSYTADQDEISDGVLGSSSLKKGDDILVMERLFQKEDTLLDLEQNKHIQLPLELRNEISAGGYDYVVRRIKNSRGKQPGRLDEFDLYASLYHFLPNRVLETYDALRYSIFMLLKAGGEYLRSKHTDANLIYATTATLPIRVTDFHDKASRPLKEQISKAINYNIPTKATASIGQPGSLVQYLRLAENLLGKSTSIEDWLNQVKQAVPSQHARTIGDKLLYRATGLDRRRDDDHLQDLVGVRSVDLPESLQAVRSQIINYFANRVYYLGPLREDPDYIYALPPYPELTHVGLKGEFTASVLERFKDRVIEFPLPPIQENGSIKIGKAKLIVALKQWLEHLGLLYGVKTTDRGKMGTELTVQSVGVKRELDLTSIGVGVSQVLPTLVMGLIAPQGTTFLLEQPELHLHPKVQSMIADFLLGLTKVGKQCIVETHSEYLVNRLRRRVAEDESNKLSQEISIYFVERHQGNSSFRKLDLNQYGALLEWPANFFDEGPNEAELIMRAALKKRQLSQAEKK